MDLGNDLREALRQTGLSTHALARKTGVSQVALSQFLRGGQMKTDTVTRLLVGLGWQVKLRAGKA